MDPYIKYDNDITISHMVAASENNVIGKGSELPWSLPEDFKYFKNKTWGMVIVMGRKTFESLKKPLPGRINIVVTKNANWNFDGVEVATDLSHAIQLAKATDCKEIFIIGGGEIFKQSLPITDRIYITRVHATVEGDVFYPVLNSNEWSLQSSDAHKKDEKNIHDFTFEVWERVSSLEK